MYLNVSPRRATAIKSIYLLSFYRKRLGKVNANVSEMNNILTECDSLASPLICPICHMYVCMPCMFCPRIWEIYSIDLSLDIVQWIALSTVILELSQNENVLHISLSELQYHVSMLLFA